jgi:Brp/Blh family beta-carotene 15,15'-monooxygenase
MSTTTSRLFGRGVEPTVHSLSRAALVSVAALFLGLRVAGATVPIATQAAVYLLGMVALNLPHGGYEHFANLRRRTATFRLWYVAAYLALAAAFVGLFLIAPVAGLALAILVAVLKGGGGDLHVLAATTGTGHLRTRGQRVLAVLARGGAVMAVPVLAFPDTFRAFSGLMVSMVDPAAMGAIAPHFGLTRPVIGLGYAGVVAAHLGLGYLRRPDTGAWLADATETILLIGYFAVVPVIVAVGLYFPLWYSARQVARELAVDAAPETGGRDLLGDRTASVGEVALRAWVALVAGALATAAVAVAFWMLVPTPLPTDSWLFGGVAFWSVFISVIALPHVVVGGLLDRTRGIWHVP